MSNAHIKPKVKPITAVTMRDLIEELVFEKEKSAHLKSEIAKLRASLADLFFAASEKILGEQDAT